MAGVAAIILAAGQSTRMKSDLPKILHEVCGRPMLSYVIDACRGAGATKIVLIVGFGKEQVIQHYGQERDLVFVEQKQRRGTAHAALCAEPELKGFKGQVLIIAGDMPLVREKTLQELLNEHQTTGDAVTLATSILDDPAGYGRIVRDSAGRLAGIVEHNDCTPEQRKIREVNPSYYCFDGVKMFDILHRVKADNAKGEYYITDSVRIALDAQWGAGAIPAVAAEDATGINSRHELALVSQMMQRRIQARHMDQGVTLVDPATTWIEFGARVGQDAVIYPFSFIGNRALISAGVRVGPMAKVTGEVRADGPDAMAGTVAARN